MTSQPHEIIQNYMLDNDAFSQWLGVVVQSVGVGSCVLQMVVRPEMTNGFGVAHGGIAFSFADSAFAFACNTHGRKAVSVEASMAYTRPIQAHDTLTATTHENHVGNTIGIYTIEIHNQHQKLVATFRGTAYRTADAW